MNLSLRITVLTALCIPFTLSAAVPTSPPTGGTPGGVFSLYFQNMVGSVPCPAGSIIKTYDTTPGTNYGKRQCVSLAAGAVKDAFSGFDPTTGAPVYMNAWLKSGTSVYYNTAGGNVGIGTNTPTAKLDVVGNIQATGNISTPASTVLTSGKVQILDIVTSGTACSPNGLIARDSVGLILSCQSGIWKSITGGGGKILQSNILSIFANSRTVDFCVVGYSVCGYFYVDPSGNLYSYRIAWINGHTTYFPASYAGARFFMNLSNTTDFNDSMGGGCGNCQTHISVSNIGVTVTTSVTGGGFGASIATVTSKTFKWLY